MKIKRLKDLREDRDFTQREIAEYLNITRSTYANYEVGYRTASIEILSDLADFYGTGIDYIVGRTDVVKPYPKGN